MDASTHKLVLSLALSALGCVATNEKQVPASAPSVANVPVMPERTIALTLGPTATELALACQEREPAQANGVDDDCDGSIDGEPARSQALLSVSLVRGADLDLSLALRGSDGQIVAPAATRTSGVCDAAAPFAITRADYPDLTPGTYEVVVTPGRACESKGAPFAHVSFQTPEQQPVALGVSIAAEPVVIATAVVR